MPRSSAYKVLYDLRPAKQTERRILLDILKIGSQSGLDLSKYQYLGFGGFKFYDFEMLFRHLGIRDMISVEGDRTLLPRCDFNKPFEFIKVRRGLLSQYLDKAVFRKPIIAWLDFDSGLSGHIIEDIRTLAAKTPIDSFVFVTIDARIPEGIRTLAPEERIAGLKEELQGFALNASIEDVETSNFPSYADRVLWAALVNAFSRRTDGSFVPLIRVFYKDTSLMITVGGCLCSGSVAEIFRKKMRDEFSFLLPRTRRSETYTIPVGNFTARERHLLDSAVTAKRLSKTVRRDLKALRFTRAAIDDYQKLVRFLPKYIETYL